jgi:nucleotide-binding universal stress UspA family protein
VKQFALDQEALDRRHHLVFSLYEEGKLSLDEYLNRAVFYEDRLGELLQSAVNFARSRGVSLTPVLREGHAAEALLACAEQEQVDLPVLGAGFTHNTGQGLGSTADQVSNHCPCAVLLAK